MSTRNPLAEFGFREITPAEDAARQRKIATCDHEPRDWRTFVGKDGAVPSGAWSDSKTGTYYVSCGKCSGARIDIASVTKRGAAVIARNLRNNARRNRTSDFSRGLRQQAREWDQIALDRP